jgi:hypothetical protein
MLAPPSPISKPNAWIAIPAAATAETMIVSWRIGA